LLLGGRFRVEAFEESHELTRENAQSSTHARISAYQRAERLKQGGIIGRVFVGFGHDLPPSTRTRPLPILRPQHNVAMRSLPAQRKSDLKVAFLVRLLRRIKHPSAGS